MNVQKRLAAKILGCSAKRVLFDENKLDQISQAITTADVRNLISQGAIIGLQKKGVSKGRSNEKKSQQSKGRARGHGSRKGLASARGETKKRLWINKVRLQREFLVALKVGKHIDGSLYRDLYRKVKGGYFRSKRHVSLYLEEKGILKAK